MRACILSMWKILVTDDIEEMNNNFYKIVSFSHLSVETG